MVFMGVRVSAWLLVGLKLKKGLGDVISSSERTNQASREDFPGRENSVRKVSDTGKSFTYLRKKKVPV